MEFWYRYTSEYIHHYCSSSYHEAKTIPDLFTRSEDSRPYVSGTDSCSGPVHDSHAETGLSKVQKNWTSRRSVLQDWRPAGESFKQLDRVRSWLVRCESTDKLVDWNNLAEDKGKWVGMYSTWWNRQDGAGQVCRESEDIWWMGGELVRERGLRDFSWEKLAGQKLMRPWFNPDPESRKQKLWYKHQIWT